MELMVRYVKAAALAVFGATLLHAVGRLIAQALVYGLVYGVGDTDEATQWWVNQAGLWLYYFPPFVAVALGWGLGLRISLIPKGSKASIAGGVLLTGLVTATTATLLEELGSGLQGPLIWALFGLCAAATIGRSLTQRHRLPIFSGSTWTMLWPAALGAAAGFVLHWYVLPELLSGYGQSDPATEAALSAAFSTFGLTVAYLVMRSRLEPGKSSVPKPASGLEPELSSSADGWG